MSNLASIPGIGKTSLELLEALLERFAKWSNVRRVASDVAEMQQQLVKAQMALEGDYEIQREYNTRLRVLMEASRDAFVFVNQSTGRIIDLNTAAAAYLGASVDELTGALLGHEMDGRKRGDVLASLASQALSDSRKPVEVVARRSKRTLLITTDAFRAAGERMLLCRIADEDDVGAEDELSENLLAFYQEGVDAIVFTDENGMIQAANESFLGFVDTSHLTRLKSRSIGDFFARGAIDLKVLVENARRVGQMRVYATKLVSGSVRAADDLGWSPRRSTLETMIADAWRWHQGGHYVK